MKSRLHSSRGSGRRCVPCHGTDEDGAYVTPHMSVSRDGVKSHTVTPALLRQCWPTVLLNRSNNYPFLPSKTGDQPVSLGMSKTSVRGTTKSNLTRCRTSKGITLITGPRNTPSLSGFLVPDTWRGRQHNHGTNSKEQPLRRRPAERHTRASGTSQGTSHRPTRQQSPRRRVAPPHER